MAQMGMVDWSSTLGAGRAGRAWTLALTSAWELATWRPREKRKGRGNVWASLH